MKEQTTRIEVQMKHAIAGMRALIEATRQLPGTDGADIVLEKEWCLQNLMQSLEPIVARGSEVRTELMAAPHWCQLTARYKAELEQRVQQIREEEERNRAEDPESWEDCDDDDWHGWAETELGVRREADELAAAKVVLPRAGCSLRDYAQHLQEFVLAGVQTLRGIRTSLMAVAEQRGRNQAYHDARAAYHGHLADLEFHLDKLSNSLSA